MDVQVMHRHPGVRSVVDDEAKAVFLNPLAPGDLLGRAVNEPEYGQVLGWDVHDRRDVLSRDDQDMNGRLGARVPEGVHLIILINRSGFDLPCDDVAEDTRIH